MAALREANAKAHMAVSGAVGAAGPTAARPVRRRAARRGAPGAARTGAPGRERQLPARAPAASAPAARATVVGRARAAPDRTAAPTAGSARPAAVWRPLPTGAPAARARTGPPQAARMARARAIRLRRPLHTR